MSLVVFENGTPIEFDYAALMAYHGPGFPGGVAHAYKVMERVFPALDEGRPIERREVHLRTAFRGPGARDAFELALRCVTGERYTVTPALERPDRGVILARYVFEFTYRDVVVTAALRDGGLVTAEFIELSRKVERSDDEEDRLSALKLEMAERLLSRSAAEVYDIDDARSRPGETASASQVG